MVLGALLMAVTNIPSERNLRKEGFVLVHTLKALCFTAKKGWP